MMIDVFNKLHCLKKNKLLIINSFLIYFALKLLPFPCSLWPVDRSATASPAPLLFPVPHLLPFVLRVIQTFA
jgi:hypothetical protein